MDFYNKNNALGLAQNIDISLNDSFNTNIFSISDDLQNMFDCFLLPNIKRNLGSFIFFDKNNALYDLFSKQKDSFGYKINKFSLNETFNIFSNLTSEDEIQIFVKSVLRNCTEIQRYLYEGKTEIDLLYTQTDLILTLILIYLQKNIPFKERSFSYINKVINKLNNNNLDYFKKIFGKIESSYKIQSSIFHLDYMTENEYKKSLSILIDILSNTTDTTTKETTIIDSINKLYQAKQPELFFIELTDIAVIDSVFCAYTEEYCYKNKLSKQSYPIIYVYAPLEKIGYVPNLHKLIENKEKNNDVHILSFNSIPTAIKLYGKDIRIIMDEIPYGLLLQTQKEKNINLIQKLLSNTCISNLITKILSDPTSLILYKKPDNISIQKKL